MKKSICISLALCLIFGTSSATFAENTTATPSLSSVTIDGNDISIGAYNINGYTYFKLRDVAAAINGTDSNFEVGYDNTSKSIALTSQTTYTADGTELLDLPTETVTTEVSTQNILLNGTVVSMEAYNIDGYNYFQLRELGKALGFGVVWNNDTKVIDLVTNSEESIAKDIDEVVDETIAEDAYTTADLQQIIDDSIGSSTILIEGTFQGESGDTILLDSDCTLYSETGAILNHISVVVDNTAAVSIHNIAFQGDGSDVAGLQIVSAAGGSSIENCSFDNYTKEAILINHIPSTESFLITNCSFYEYGLAEGSVDSAIVLSSDVTLPILLEITNNTFTVSREDADMDIDDMDLAFMTVTNLDTKEIFGQLNLIFTGNTITKGSRTYSVDIAATCKESASIIE